MNDTIPPEKPIQNQDLVHLTGYGLVSQVIAGLEIERERKGMTKTDLAKAMNVPPARITEWTTGKVRPGIDVVELWVLTLGLRIQLVSASTSKFDPTQLDDEQLARIAWALQHKSRRVAKSILSQTMPADAHATSGDLSVVQKFLSQHPRKTQIENIAERNKNDYEKTNHTP